MAGPEYCKQKDLEYVDYNQAQTQIAVSGIHFIFALDESGSMNGRKWSDLIKALTSTLEDIKKFSSSSSNNKISILNFETDYRIIYEREEPNNIDIHKIQYGGGGTSFEPVFNAAYRIASKTIASETIYFIFMTDGHAEYPSKGISKF